MEKLESMREFVLNSRITKADESDMIRYANFLSQPLTLGMFVPCDDEGNVLETPENKMVIGRGAFKYEQELKAYEEAKSHVLFKGGKYVDLQPSTTYNYFEINGKKIFKDSNTKTNCSLGYTIEDLVNSKVIITESAINQIFI